MCKITSKCKLLFNRRMAVMMKSYDPWSTSVQGMALNRSSSSLRSWMWTGPTATPCSPFWRRSFPSPAIIPRPSWLIPSSSSGVQCVEMMSPGTLRSSWWVLTGNPTSATAEPSSLWTLRQTFRSFSKGSDKAYQQWAAGGLIMSTFSCKSCVY